MKYISTSLSVQFFFLFFLFYAVGLNAQNIGIGTANPVSKLDVSGGVSIGTGYAGNQVAPLNGLLVEGNVGIGVVNPISRLHVVNTIAGIHGLLSHSNASSKASIVGRNLQELLGIGVIGISGNYPIDNFGGFPFPSSAFTFIEFPGIGGSFAGKIGVYAFTNKDDAIAVLAENADMNGYAAYFLGNIAAEGLIRNPNANLYGGSVFVNDGLTVGSLGGGSECYTKVPDNGDCTFMFFNPASGEPGHVNWLMADEEKPNFSPVINHDITCNSGDCRSITNVLLKVSFRDYQTSLSFTNISSEIWVSNKYMGHLLIPIIDPNLGHTLWQDFLYYHPPVHFNSLAFNGLDPDEVDWNFYYRRINLPGLQNDGDQIHEYNVEVSYNYGTVGNEMIYAAHGEIRASGTIYANATSPYGDVAEFFPVIEKSGGRTPEAGDIVSFNINQEETFSLSSKAYDSYIAGVVSENPSVFLNNPDMGEPIALTGRVRVKVNTEGGKINIGDPITSSSVEGVGMRAKNSTVVIGHAMQAFDGERTGEGKIWILLGRTHFAGVNSNRTIYQHDSNIGAIDVRGSLRVDKNENTAFIPWGDNIKDRISMSEIDFDALYADLNPFGGYARLSVREINEEGVYVNISDNDRDESFKGFYYGVKLISPVFAEIQQGSETPVISVKDELSFDEKMNKIINLFNKSEVLFQRTLSDTGLETRYRRLQQSSTSKEDILKFNEELNQKAHAQMKALYQIRLEIAELLGDNSELMTAVGNAIKNQ